MSSATQAGWASVAITPRPPVAMGGYAARTGQAEGIHDPLLALALALGSPSEPLILVVCDLLSVDASLVQQVRERVGRALPSAKLWMAATHTHSGPDVGHGFASAAPRSDVLERIVAGAAQAAVDAARSMRAVRGGWVSTPVHGIATNRDHPDRDEEIALDLLCLFDAQPSTARDSGQPCAILGSLPCHPTVLSAANLMLSADLPGAFRSGLRRALGSNSWVALATGAGGDISTRHTRRGQGFDELDRLGSSLVEQTLAALDRVEPIALSAPCVQQQVLPLTRRSTPSLQELQALRRPLLEQRERALQAGESGQARTLETALQGLDGSVRVAGVGDREPIDALVSVAMLGDLALAAIPGELYHQLGDQLRHALRDRALILAYANGYIGYIPTREAYGALDYEVLMSPLAPGSGEQLRDAALELLASSPVPGV